MKRLTCISKTISGLVTISILGLGFPVEAQTASSHVKVGTWNNFTSTGYVHGSGSAYSQQQGGVHIEGLGNSTVIPCHTCGNSSTHGVYGFRGGYSFERGAGISGTGSFSLNETNHFGMEGSSWTKFNW